MTLNDQRKSSPTEVVAEVEYVEVTNDQTEVSKKIELQEADEKEATEEDEDPHMDVETPRTFNVITTKSLDTMP